MTSGTIVATNTLPNCQPLRLPKKASMSEMPTMITPNSQAHGLEGQEGAADADPDEAHQERPPAGERDVGEDLAGPEDDVAEDLQALEQVDDARRERRGSR